MGVNQGDLQQSVRTQTGTANDYNGDWSALFDQAAIPAGDWDGRMLQWINQQLAVTYTNLPQAQTAYAVSQGYFAWSAMGTISLLPALALVLRSTNAVLDRAGNNVVTRV